MVSPKETRKKYIEKEIERREESDGERETLRLDWKGESKVFPVVKISTDKVVLNPNSHRIQSQIKSHPEEERLRRDPFSEYAQQTFAEMLRDTDGYEDLKENLRNEGQREAGVVTRSGLLVNANRRTTALREIEGMRHVRAAVLPKGVSNEEILDVEADLQVRRQFQADYTFTNRLLLIDKLLTDYGRSKKEVALQLREATSDTPKHVKEGKKKIDRYLQQLALIRDAQELSAVDGEPKVDLVFFDDKQQSVSELESEYRKLKSKGRDSEARRLKRNRLLGLLAGLGYQKLRRVDDRFFEDYFLEAIDELEIEGELSSDLEGMLESNGGSTTDESSDSNLNLLGNTQESADSVSDAGPLVEKLAQSQGEDTVEVQGQNGETTSIPREGVITDVQKVFDRGTEHVRQDSREEDLLTTPIKRADTAASKLRKALSKYKEARSHSNFDRKTMSKKIENAKAALQDLLEAFQADAQ